MRAAIIRRIEAAEQAAPVRTGSRIVFMPKGVDEPEFRAAAEARNVGSEIHAIEVLPFDLSDDATAAHALMDALGRLPVRDRKHSETPHRFDLDTARRLAFIAARARRKIHQ